MVSAVDLLDDVIAELEGRLNLKPGQAIKLERTAATGPSASSTNKTKQAKQNKKAPAPKREKKEPPPAPPEDQPDICKLEFKVGVITKVWVHEKADKLYCEEIDVGEDAPRQIASGLRPHFTEEQMLGQRLLVVSNLKAKNLVGFKSHGMVLCAAQALDDSGSEKVEFVEPPADAPIGEVVTFEGLPPPHPLSAAQVEKKKVFQACLDGMQTLDDCRAAWKGHVFTTTAGPCRAKTVSGGPMR